MLILAALRDGVRTVARSWGLVALLLGVNLGVAALLAVPLAEVLERDLRHHDAAGRMMYGFDFAWWSHWSEAQQDWKSSFGPDILGVGFAFKNLDLLLRGELPARLFTRRGELDPVILSLGAAYILIQTFLIGGILGVFRAPQGSWTLRGLIHGSGFYFGRLARVACLALVADYVLFRLNVPLARFVDRRAFEAETETHAMTLVFGRYALLLLSLLFVHMISCYAKIIVVVEERSSAILALASSLSFCLRHVIRAAGHYLAVAGLGVLLLVVWSGLDGHWNATGYKSQLVTLLLAQGLIVGRIVLRLSLFGGQLALYRRASA
jgi:hypothetical protein